VNKPVIGIAAVVVVVGIGIAYYFHGRNTLPPSEPIPMTPPPAAGGEPAIEHPVPTSVGTQTAPLPPLNESDPAVKDGLSALFGANAMQYLVPEDIVRHIVVTVDNLPRQKAPAAKRPTVAVQGAFLADGDELHATLDPKNFGRYDPMVNVVRQLDMQRMANTYFHFYPLFQGAYQNLGYPNGYFNDRLVQVIDSLLATPQPSGPIELTRPNVLYTFADPDLEALPAGQKLMLRMGPDNAAVVKGKLKELRAIITAAPPKH
jgi:Protein of unknown function (DUF3014)